MIKFEIFGTKIKISFLFVCFISWMLLNNKHNITQIYIFSALFHECSHILAIMIFSSSIKEIKFEICGVTIKAQKKLSNPKELIVLASGCFGNFVLLIFFTILKLKTAAIINLIILAINILPHEKLDGGQILFKILSSVTNSYTSFKIIKATTISVTTILATTSLFAIIYSKNFAFLLTFLFFMLSLFFSA